MYDHSQLSLFAFIILISSSGNLRSFRELISGGGGDFSVSEFIPR